MALDAELQIVDSQVVDVSEGTNQLSTAGGSVEGTNLLTLGRRGIPRDATFVVNIEAVTAAAAGANVIPVQFILQVSNDGGSAYVDVCTITLTLAASLARVGIWSKAIGLVDSRQEVRLTGDQVVRVNVTYTNNGETDDFTYSAYIAGPNPYPSDDIA